MMLTKGPLRSPGFQQKLLGHFHSGPCPKWGVTIRVIEVIFAIRLLPFTSYIHIYIYIYIHIEIDR